MNNKELKASLILLGFVEEKAKIIQDWRLRNESTGITVRYSSKEFVSTAYKAWGIEEPLLKTNHAKEVLDFVTYKYHD